MFYEYLKNINGVTIYPIIGFFVFFIFFIAISIHTFRLKKSDIKKMAEMPLDDGVEFIEKTNL